MLILHDPDTLLHDTVEFIGSRLIPALECPQRLTAILTAIRSPNSPHELQTVSSLVASENADDTQHHPIPHHLQDALIATHSAAYLEHLQSAFDDWLKAGLIISEDSILPECFPFAISTSSTSSNPLNTSQPIQPPSNIFARTGFYAFDMSTGIMKDTHRSIIASANLAYDGTKLLFPEASSSSTPDTILSLTRPPGHHCDGHRAGGYCYINNSAVAITTYQSLLPPSTPCRTAILDLDFHHGNGTQQIFYSTSTTLYVSIHGEDEYPYYSGSANEVGAGDGHGYNLNLPLRIGASSDEYIAKLEVALKRVEEYDPPFLVISLGFDTFQLDPLGSFKLDTEDYEVIGRKVRQVVKRISERRIQNMSPQTVKSLILLEGGYVVDQLGPNLLSWLKGWESI